MPPQPKPWVNAGSSSTPIDSPALIGLEYRTANYVGSSEIGVGVGAYEDFRVKQQGAGAMAVDVGLTSTQRAVLPGDSNGGTNRFDYAGAQLSAIVAANASGNPRIDIVTLAPPATSDSQLAQVLIITGTPTAGASLANRNGAAALPNGRILLADLLVPNGASAILTAQISDRRKFPYPGTVPPVYTGIDQVIPESIGGVPMGTQTITQGTNDNRACAMMFYLPRRILATRIRWKYRQGATAASSTYTWMVFDSSGKGVIDALAVNFAGAATTGRAENVALQAATQLEAGMFWAVFMCASMGAGASVSYSGYQGTQAATNPGVAAPNLYAYGPAATFPGLASSIPGTMFDAITALTDTPGALPMPAFTFGA